MCMCKYIYIYEDVLYSNVEAAEPKNNSSILCWASLSI